uniref:Protein FAM204A-like isoform X3 n=1 Tax=Crassostrea virginica TaxID=6565 RepID=A0A8B8F0Q9_CRAVI|nr:protein FAM204A-like isoform X3 [Crassostrea virginica]
MFSRVPPISSVVDESTSAECKQKPTAKVDSSETTDRSTSDRPKNVRADLWNKFKALEEKTNEVTRRSTEKRIKHLQKTLMQKVQEEITDEEDRDILRQHDVKFGPPVIDETCSSRKRKHPKNEREQDTKTKTQNSGEWKNIKGYLNVNDHLKGTDPGKYAPKSSLEQKIDKSISEGDFETAEKLSDYMSTREFGKKIADAIDAKKYSQELEEKKESSKEKKKKKLAWGSWL